MGWNDNKVDVVIDIETVVNPVTHEEIEAFKKDIKPPSNYKDPEKINEYLKKAYAQAENDLIDSKRFSFGGKRMISCALGIVTHDAVVDIQSWAGDDLSLITKHVCLYLDDVGEYRLIGWNHKKFDLPELAKSFAKTGIRPRTKPGKWDLIDLCDHPFKSCKMKDIAQALGLELSDTTAESVQGLYEKEDFDTIMKYNEHDVYLTGKIYIAACTIFTF